MKVSNSSAGVKASASPTMKKLKQARLPFQVISPSVTKTTPKKRKLSENEDESVKKVCKPSVPTKESEVKEDIPIDPVVVIEDDDSSSDTREKDAIEPAKPLNPFVSLVDVALKRKLRKKTTPAKKKLKKSRNEKVTKDNSVDDIQSIEPKTKPVPEDAVEISEHNVEKPIDRLDNKENCDEVILVDELSNDACVEKPINENDINKSEPIVDPPSVTEMDCNTSTIESDLKDNNQSNESTSNVSTKDTEINSSDEIESENDVSDHSSAEQENTDNTKSEVHTDVSETASSQDHDKETIQQDFITPKSNKRRSKRCDSAKTASSDKKIVSQQVNSESKDCSKALFENPNSPKSPSDLKKLTPKQIQKRMESLKKQQEREKEKLERQKKRDEEKEEKNRLRLEKEEQKRKEREEKEEQKKKEREEKEKQKEQEKKEREEKEEAKRKEKEEKELQKKREKEAKDEERRMKDLEREEEKRKKELEKEEAELKKKKAAAAFVNFFVPKASGSKSNVDHYEEDTIKHDYLSNFTKKSDMRLAPLNRNPMSEERRNTLDEMLIQQEIEKCDLFIAGLKKCGYEIKTSGRTWQLEDNDIEIIEDELPIDSTGIVLEDHKQTLRAKLLSFSENRRPPYWGTWRRKSRHITGRRPFGMDSTILDYDCDSDEEWEDEEPGESVGGSVAGSDDEEGDNDYDVDNEFMVPHGYLSEEEAMGEEDEVLSPESQKAKLKILQCEFENEMKKSTEKLHPRLLGILWQKSDGSQPDSCKDSVWNFLSNRKILTEEEQIIIRPLQINNECEPEDLNEKSAKKSRKIKDEMIPDLIKLIHGNTNNRGFLAHEFQTYISNLTDIKDAGISKLSIAKKIKEISKWMACPVEGPMHGKMCWFVASEILTKFDVNIALPNSWTYTLTPKRRSEVKTPQQTNTANNDQVKNATKEPTSENKDNAFNITKFTKKLTQEEIEKQFHSTKSDSSTKTPEVGQAAPPAKKRVSLLFSGPIGKPLATSTSAQEPPKCIKSNLLTKFIKTIPNDKLKKNEATSTQEPMEVDNTNEDCVVLSD